MNEQLRQSSAARAEMLRDVNQRLRVTVQPIAQLAREVLVLDDIPEHVRNVIEFRAGRSIKRIIQDHVDTYMTFEGIRGVDIGVGPGIVLDVESRELFDVGRSDRSRYPARPLSDKAWLRHCEDILGCVTSLKSY